MLVSFYIIVPLRTLQANAQFQAIDENVTSIARLKTYLNIASVLPFPPSALDCRDYLIAAQFPRPNSLSLFFSNDIAVSTQLNHRTTNTSAAVHLPFETFIMPFRAYASAFENFYLIRNGIMHKN